MDSPSEISSNGAKARKGQLDVAFPNRFDQGTTQRGIVPDGKLKPKSLESSVTMVAASKPSQDYHQAIVTGRLINDKYTVQR